MIPSTTGLTTIEDPISGKIRDAAVTFLYSRTVLRVSHRLSVAACARLSAVPKERIAEIRREIGQIRGEAALLGRSLRDYSRENYDARMRR